MERYWLERAERAIKRMEGKVRDDIPELVDSFNQAKRDLQKEINSFYGRYAHENKISLAEAQKQLSFKELQEFKGNLKAYEALSKNSIGTYNLQLNNLSTKARITRLQALEFECDTILQRLYQQMHENIERSVAEVYTNQFYHAQFDIAQYTGFQHKFSKVSQSAIDKVLAMPVQGADISTRLWRQDIDTGFKIRQSLNNMFTTGKPPQDFAKELQSVIGVRNAEGNLTGKKYEAYRLLYNESAYATNQANLDAYQSDGLEEYEVCATMDLKTSQICRDMDNKHFPIDKAVVGETFPPFHVNCRTTTVPYIEGLKTNRMARDIETGKSSRVKEQSYQEWYQSNIDKYSDKKVKTTERMLKNESSDFRQYEKYKDILGKNSPKSFAKFQELKYNDSNEYDDLKGLASYLKKYPDSSKEYYLINQDLKKAGIKDGIALPPKPKQAFILPDPTNKRDPNHIMRRMNERNLTDDMIRNYMQNAKIMFSQWSGQRQKFYSDEGICVITKVVEDWLFKTAFSKEDFDETTLKVLEVMNKHVK